MASLNKETKTKIIRTVARIFFGLVGVNVLALSIVRISQGELGFWYGSGLLTGPITLWVAMFEEDWLF